jgi:tetratricopeptide (TPR) repeat protein
VYKYLFCIFAAKKLINVPTKLLKIMKKSLMLTALTFASVWSLAQIRTPQPSPAATVMQTIGVTDITVKYSRPAMKGREIFGKLVPYGQFWRTGANQATAIEFSTDVMLEDKNVPAGKYFLYSIPNADSWTVIINKTAATAPEQYKEADDVARVTVKPTAAPTTESFMIGFSTITDSTATLDIMWDKVKVSPKLSVNTTKIVATSIDKSAEASANNMNAGAGYLLSKGMDLQKALSMINQAVSYKETFRNLWTKAQILGKLGNFAEAAPLAKKALELGQASNDTAFPFFKDAIEKGAAEFASKIPVPTLPTVKKKK